MKPIYLKTARVRAGLTQEELSEQTGIAQAAISKLETGAAMGPMADTLLKLAAALSVAPQALRFGPDPRSERKAS